MRILAGFLGERASNDSGVVEDGNSASFALAIFRPLGYMAYIYMIYSPRRLFSYLQMHDLE